MKLALEESVELNDQVFELGGVKFLIHANAIPFFKKNKIDFVKNYYGDWEFKLMKL